MASAPQSMPYGERAEPGPPLRVRLQPALCPTDDQFYDFCRLNRELRIERNATGDVTIMAPAAWESSRRNADITAQLFAWALEDGNGVAADSSAGYVLPNGAVRSPDASWLSNERLASASAEQRSRFLPLCPEFVIELRSTSDRLPAMREKVVEYQANGAELGWLIDPMNQTAFVYRKGEEATQLRAPKHLSAKPVLPGFRLDLHRIW